MSLDDAKDPRSLNHLRDEISKIIERRNLKLRHLYEAQNFGASPGSDQRNLEIEQLLDQFDLEKGRYIELSNLPAYRPPSIQHASFVVKVPSRSSSVELSTSIPSTTTAPPTHSAPSPLSVTPGVIEPKAVATGTISFSTIVEDRPQQAVPIFQMTASLTKGVQDASRKHAHPSKTAATLSGVFVEQTTPHRPHKKPRLDLQTDKPKRRVALSRGSQLESPPYSPEVDQNGATSVNPEDEPALQTSAELADTPNSRKDSQSNVPLFLPSSQGAGPDESQEVEPFATTHQAPEDIQLPPPLVTGLEQAQTSLLVSAVESVDVGLTKASLASVTSVEDNKLSSITTNVVPSNIAKPTNENLTEFTSMDVSSGFKKRKRLTVVDTVSQRLADKHLTEHDMLSESVQNEFRECGSTFLQDLVPSTKQAQVSIAIDLGGLSPQQSHLVGAPNLSGTEGVILATGAENTPPRNTISSDHVSSTGPARADSFNEIVDGDKELSTAPRTSLQQPDQDLNIVKATGIDTPASRFSQRSSSARIEKAQHRGKGRNFDVILGKPYKQRYYEMMRSLRNSTSQTSTRLSNPKKHYLNQLFRQQAFKVAKSNDLTYLLRNASKTLTTSDWMADFREQKDNLVLDRVRGLQSENRWFLRQKKPCPEVPAPESNLDLLLRDMKCLQTDFREERKLKICVARLLAESCARWVDLRSYGKQGYLQVKLKSSAPLLRADVEKRSVPVLDSSMTQLENTVNGETATLVDSLQPDWMVEHGAQPDAIFLNVSRSIIGENLLSQLPAFPPGESHLYGKMATQDAPLTPARITDLEDLFALESSESHPEVCPEDDFCALFVAESKPLRTRLNAQWAFKPPSANMPPLGFYENRVASQWTWDDDQQLRGLVKEYPSNWTLISDKMSSKAQFSSAITRRTPWECYERLLILEGPPADANVRPYFRHFHAKLDQARNRFQAFQSATDQRLQQLAQDTGIPVASYQMKRFPSPVRVDRKVDRKVLAMLDSAKKLARKRESKQQQQGQLPEVPTQSQRPPLRLNPSRSPQYFCQLKHEREKDERRRQEHIRQHQKQMYHAQLQQRGQHTALTNGIAQQMHNGLSNGSATGLSANTQIPVSVQGQPRPPPHHPNIQSSLSNGVMPNAQIGASGRPQANMQATQRLAPQLNVSTPRSSEEVQRLMLQAQQQRHLQQFQSQQLQHNPMHGQLYVHGSPNMAGVNGVPNSGILAQFSNHGVAVAGGMQSPGIAQPNANGLTPSDTAQLPPQLNASSNGGSQPLHGTNHPRPHPHPHPQSLSNGLVPAVNALQHRLAANYPQMSQDEIRHRAGEQMIKDAYAQSRRNAINAAAGIHRQPQPNSSYLQQASNIVPHSSPYQQNGVLMSNYPHAGRSVSPNQGGQGAIPTSMQAQQQLYQHQLRQEVLQQRPSSIAGSPVLHPASPSIGVGVPTVNGNQGMRPPSRNAAVIVSPD